MTARALRSLPALATLLLWSSAARAEEPRFVVDAGLSLARPAALPTGLSTGIAAGIAGRGLVTWCGRVSWASATEYTTTWSVRQSDLRLRACGQLQHQAGRGLLALRLGAGGTLVHETRIRNQGRRAGLTGDDLEQTAWKLLPAADLEAAIQLRFAGAWIVNLSGGPSLSLVGSEARLGWVGELGVARAW